LALSAVAGARVDRVLTSRWLGAPVYLLVMWGVFVAATRSAGLLQTRLAAVINGPVAAAVRAGLDAVRLGDTWVAGLVLDGVLVGVGQLLTFVPLMTIMFALLAVLEDCGYLARAAFITHRLLRPLGLPGQACLPLIVGLGCNVPAVAGARVVTDPRRRLVTVLLVPFVSCSGRLTVYALLAGAFFGSRAGTVVFGMYLLSIVLVVAAGVGLRYTLLRRPPPPSPALELPPYRLPSVRTIAAQTGQRLAGFLRTAGGIIVATTVAVWLLAAIPTNGGRFGAVDPADSLYGTTSRAMAPLFAPAGFDDWRIGGALLSGFVAKEAVVTTLAQTHQADEPGELNRQLTETMRQASGGHPGPAALALLVFVLAYTPCAATVAAQRAEIGGRWAAAGAGLQLVVAWLLATLVFQVGRLVT
jgi:ferrous iron transport protein B